MYAIFKQKAYSVQVSPRALAKYIVCKCTFRDEFGLLL